MSVFPCMRSTNNYTVPFKCLWDSLGGMYFTTIWFLKNASKHGLSVSTWDGQESIQPHNIGCNGHEKCSKLCK